MKTISRLFGVIAIMAITLCCTKEKNTKGEDTYAQEDRTSQEDVSVTPTGPMDLFHYDPAIYLLGIGAEFEGFTKADFEFNEGSKKGKVVFDADDAVLVYVPSIESTGTYQWNGEDLFTPATEEDAIAIGDNEAFVYYPASEFEVVSRTAKFTVPAAITAGSTKDLGSKSPMVGHIASGAEKDASGRAQVVFKNLGAILRVGFHSPEGIIRGETITKVELSSDGKSITGTGTVGWDADNDIPTLTDLETGTESITIEDIEDGGLIPDSDRVFYFFLPVNANSEDALGALEVKAIYGKTVGEVIYEPYETITRGALVPARNTIYSLSKPLAGFFSGGDGSEDHPYIIANASDFDQIYANWGHSEPNDNIGYNGTDTFFGHASYQQTAEDINFDGKTYNVIGTSTKPFYGIYDGNGKTISNVSIGNGGSSGLFGYTSGAIIKNWTATNISVSGTGANRGAFIGFMAGGEVNNCDVAGTSMVSGDAAAIGGIVGSIRNAKGIITGCESTANVTNTATSGNYATGGIVGLVYTGADNSEVSSCATHGNVTNGCNYTGGIVGRFNVKGTLSSCSTTSGFTITGVTNAGGIAGEIIANVTISNCTNNANIEAQHTVGGIVGLQTAGNTQNCTNKGSVTATGKDGSLAKCGGIVGSMVAGTVGGSEANAVENTGLVTASTGNACGGLVGLMASGTISYSHSANTVSGIHNAGGIVGLITGSGAVRKCYNAGNVTCTGNQIGGIVGQMQSGAIESCYSKNGITIQGTDRVGGIAGTALASNGHAVVINCAAKSTVKATTATARLTNGFAGGIVGEIRSNGTSYRAVLANCVALAAKVYGVVDNIPVGAVVGLINASDKSYTVVENCYSQANSDAFIGYSENAGTTVQNCTKYSGGIYGYLLKGTVMDCYYTKNTTTPGAGTVSSTAADINVLSPTGGSNGLLQISNSVKNGSGKFSLGVTHYFQNDSFQNLSFTAQSVTLGEALEIGTWINGSKTLQTYNSSVGTETLSSWINWNTGSIQCAYPATLYDLGTNYRN